MSGRGIILTDTAVEDVAGRLGISSAKLKQEILTPHMKVGGESVARQQTEDQVHVALQALAKDLYFRLFKWLVSFINEVLYRKPTCGLMILRN